ncbi:MAG TPA: ATP-binding cassette domain-containing protein [Thermoanaerobaculia bacterium]|nr:ATP-binding cassette domain-containing protein [Thermoanaerobaculia bacterium]
MSSIVPMLELSLIRKSYGDNEVLRGFSGTFSAGRIAALVGPNGAGKTTLLRISAGLQRADSGLIRSGRALYYGGFDLLPVKGSVDQLRRGLGLPPASKGGRKLSRLSRGELHRVGLDIALDLVPDVLLLDEPWTALEPDARDTLNIELRAHAPNRVVICSSHDLDEVARVADDVVFLAGGVGTWKRRDEDAAAFDREELIRAYRESKRTT